MFTRKIEKFKLLYLRNNISYFNKIRRIMILTYSLKVRLKSVLPWLKYSIFVGDCFFYWRTLYICGKLAAK